MIDLREFMRRFLYLGKRKELDRELEEEIRFHIEMKARELVENGLSEEEARYTAIREFGNRGLTKQDSKGS